MVFSARLTSPKCRCTRSGSHVDVQINGMWVLQGSFLRLGSSHNSPQGPHQRQAPTGMEFGAARAGPACWDNVA